MRKLLFISFLFAGLLSAKSYTGYKSLANPDSINATANDTITVNLDTYRAYAKDYDLVSYGRFQYKAFSTAGNVALRIRLEYSPDNTNWTAVPGDTLEDSLATEATWKHAAIPSNAKYFKYMRVIVDGLSANNADSAFWLKLLWRWR